MSAQQGKKELHVIELFAGVGGFRLGLEAVHGRPYKVTLSNQFEPSKKKQHASDIYTAHWPHEAHINDDIARVLESATGQQAIRDAKPDLVVGGFPCQDYSVARPLSQSHGLEGKRGVLFWSIAKLLEQRSADGEPVPYLILENVDRLLSSPASCRGRDFAVVLSALHSLGYAVEWRVINAADYGYPQKRRRVFIVAYHETTALYGRLLAAADGHRGEWHSDGVLNAALPGVLSNELDGYAPALTVQSDPFSEQLGYRPLSNGKTRFASAGFMCKGQVWTCAARALAIEDFTDFTGSSAPLTLGDVINKTGPVPSDFYVRTESEAAWRAAKSAKSIPREKDGFTYRYSEGSMVFPDPLDRPARTIITSEGGSTASRTKHCVREKSGLLRRLTPEELEELMGFPRGFTELDLRNIKTTMGMDVLHCQTAHMNEKEIWVHLLAYNVIRLLMAHAASHYATDPRTLSFKHTLQLWTEWLARGLTATHDQSLLFKLIAQSRVGNRPGRIEPRMRKRRPKSYPWLKEPRHIARERVRRYGHVPRA